MILLLTTVVFCFSIGGIDGYWPEPTGECLETQEAFLRAYNDFYNCTVKYARITSFCMDCVFEFNNLENVYYSFKDTHQTHLKENVSCYDVLCRQDDIGIPCRMYQESAKLWRHFGHCDNCFINETSGSYVLKQSVINFLEKFSTVDFCFDLFKDDGYDSDDNNTHPACSLCHEEYLDFEQFYFHIWHYDDKDDMQSCRDIYDKYNITMKTWSKEFGCKRRSYSNYYEPYLMLGGYVFVLGFTIYFTFAKIIPALGFDMNKTKSRTKVGSYPYLLSNPRMMEDWTLTEEEINDIKKCFCLPKLAAFVKKSRNLRPRYRSERNPSTYDVCLIHKRYGDSFHRYLTEIER